MSTSRKLAIIALLLLPNALFGQLKSYSATFEMTMSFVDSKLYDDPLQDYQPINGTVISTYTANRRKVEFLNSEYNYCSIKDIQKNLEVNLNYNLYMKTVQYTCQPITIDVGAQETDYSPYYDPEYEYTEPKIDTTVIAVADTKKILGYNCKRTILSISNGETYIIWSTDEIDNYDEHGFGSYITGFVMEFTRMTNNEEIVYKATKIESVTDDAISFDPPAGYILRGPSSSILDGEFDYSYDSDCLELLEPYELSKSVKKLNSEIKKIRKKWNSPDFEDFFAEIQLDENGNVLNCFIYSDKESMSEELESLLSSENTWTPTKVNGKPVPCSFEFRF